MENFKFISSNINDPYFNLASEEYLLKQKGGYYIYLWINSPAVIIGNNQNTLLEVNLNTASEKDIKIVRRLTGGGAVYHDLNNICYTIIAPFDNSENNYIKFTNPVISYLQSLGVNAKFSGRNDICIEDQKISGNAQVIYKDRIMHHGTILFDTDLSVLTDVLIENKLKTQSKGVKSIRARVTNIIEHLKKDMSAKEFYDGLCTFMKKDYEEYSFSQEDLSKINELKENKYQTYEWNVGYSPKGNSRFDGRFDFGTITLTFDLINGIINNAEMFGDYFSNKNVSQIISKLNGKRFIKEEIALALSGIENYIAGANATEIADKLFL